MNRVEIVYRQKPQGIDVGDNARLKQVWNRFTNRNFYYCPWCHGWIEGRIDLNVFEDMLCLRCRNTIK